MSTISEVLYCSACDGAVSGLWNREVSAIEGALIHTGIGSGLLYLEDHGSTDYRSTDYRSTDYRSTDYRSTDYKMNIFHCSLEMFISIVSVL